MKWYIGIFIIVALFGCKDTVQTQVIKERLLLENKKYFNSERAAKILYEEATKYLKYGTFSYPRPNTQLVYYTLLGDEPPYRMQVITKRQADQIDKNNGIYVKCYIDKENRIDASIVSYSRSVFHSFDVINKKILLKSKIDNIDVTQTQSYTTSFNLENGTFVTEEGKGDIVTYGQGYPNEFSNRAFENYASYYNKKEDIYSNKSRIVQKIDYKNKKIKYYFYNYNKRYEIICNYINERCEIKHNCVRKFNVKECGFYYYDMDLKVFKNWST